jgi:hypothetical protein
VTDESAEKDGMSSEPAEDAHEQAEPNPVTGEVVLQLVAARDPNTPLFNETIDELADQLPSLSNREPPAGDEQQNDDENDRGEGEHD